MKPTKLGKIIAYGAVIGAVCGLLLDAPWNYIAAILGGSLLGVIL